MALNVTSVGVGFSRVCVAEAVLLLFLLLLLLMLLCTLLLW